jgi:L-seryl-tRNA(Ser) seleniumtransferase
VRAGADLVLWSGDKLLGGPQAGCLAGRAALVALTRKNPFARALRADKLTLAALEATLTLYHDPEQAIRQIPVLRMLTLSPPELLARAERLRNALPPSSLQPGFSAVGGGAFPGAALPTTLVAIDPGALGAAGLALRLRLGVPSVISRIEGGMVLLDPRTIPEAELDAVAAAVQVALEDDR